MTSRFQELQMLLLLPLLLGGCALHHSRVAEVLDGTIDAEMAMETESAPARFFPVAAAKPLPGGESAETGGAVGLAASEIPWETIPASENGPPTGTTALAMTIEDALAHALTHHPRLLAREHEIEMARARLVAAGQLDNPRFVMDTDSPVYESGPTELSSRLTFTYPTANKIWHRENLALAGIRRAQTSLERDAEIVLLEAADAAVQVMYLQELVRIDTELQEIAAERATSVQPEFSPDLEVNIVDRVEAKIAAVEARTDTLDASRQLTLARSRLAQAIGSPCAIVHLSGTLDVVPLPLRPLCEIVSIGRHNNPRLAQAWSSVLESQRQFDLANAEAVPDLELGPRYQDVLGEDDDQIGARFAFDLPILNHNEGAILEAAATTRANQAYANLAELDSVSEIAAAYLELQRLMEGLRYFENQVREVTHESEVSMQDPNVRRLMSGTQALRIRQVLSRLKLRHLELKYRYHRLVAQIEILIGDEVTMTPLRTDGEIRFDPQELDPIRTNRSAPASRDDDVRFSDRAPPEPTA